MSRFLKQALAITVALAVACESDDSSQTVRVEFHSPVKVTVQGYDGNLMEPFVTRNGEYLFFNNLNEAPENTNLHYAVYVNDTTFNYAGEMEGINTVDLEGTPTMDINNNLYFVSTRSYATTFSTLHRAVFSDGLATDVQLLSGVSKNQSGFVNFDVEINEAGEQLYFIDSQFDANNKPMTADIVIAQKAGNTTFQRLATSSELMQNINTDALEYAPSLSVDELELYFTRVDAPLTAVSSPEIFIATRKSKTGPFDMPAKVRAIEGFVEAPTISANGKWLYYHKKEGGKLVLYCVVR